MPRFLHMARFVTHGRSLELQKLFIEAARSGDLQTLTSLKLSNLASESVAATCYEALQFAAKNGHATIVMNLLYAREARLPKLKWMWMSFEQSEGFSKWNFWGSYVTSSPLHLAVKEGHLEVVQQILPFLRSAIDDGREAVRYFEGIVEWAVRWGHVPIVKLLLSQPMLGNEVLSVPLHLAAHLNHVNVLELLLQLCKHEVLLSYPVFSKDGFTSLHLAAQSGSLSAVKLLLNEAEMDVNARSHPDFFTPLHMAANSGHVEVVSFLLQSFEADFVQVAASNRLDLMARDCMGRTALHYAVREGHEGVVQLLLDCADKMPGNNIASIADHDGLLPLHIAARAGHVGLIKKLRYYGGINSKAMHSVNMKIRVEMEYMIEERIETNIYCEEKWKFPRPKLIDSFFWKTEGFTPLHFAARYGHDAAVTELLKEGSSAGLHLREHEGLWTEVQNKAVASLTLNGEGGLKEAATLCRSKINEEEKAMKELQHAWDTGICPALKMHIVQWLEEEDIGSFRMFWLARAVNTGDLDLLKRLLVVFREFQASDPDSCDGCVALLHYEAVREALHEAVAQNDSRSVRELLLHPPGIKPEDVYALLSEVLCIEDANDRSGCVRELLLHGPGIEEKDVLNLLTDALRQKGTWYNSRCVRELLLHLPGIETEDAVTILCEAFARAHYGAAKEILLQVPRVVLMNNRVAKKVERFILRRRNLKEPLVGNSEQLMDFLMALVTRDGLVGSSTLLRVMLTWAKSEDLESLVEVILDRPELKKGLYEDRQVYLDCANAILVGAALIAGVAFQGWLQPPLGYNYPYDQGEQYAELQKPMVRMFWRFNNGAFFLAVGALIVGAKGAVPVANDTDIVMSVEKAQRAVAVASTLLGLALVSVVVAFTAAGFAVLPPQLPSEMHMMRTSVAWGGTICGIALLWFYRSVLPLLRYYIILARTILAYVFLVPYWLLRCILDRSHIQSSRLQRWGDTLKEYITEPPVRASVVEKLPSQNFQNLLREKFPRHNGRF